MVEYGELIDPTWWMTDMVSCTCKSCIIQPCRINLDVSYEQDTSHCFLLMRYHWELVVRTYNSVFILQRLSASNTTYYPATVP